MKIPQYIQDVIENQELHIISTASKDAVPNIVYVKFLKVYNDKQVLVANNKFHKTENNLLKNPKMSFVVFDEENKVAYQLKGSTETHTEGKVFDDTVEWVKEKKPDMHPKAGVLINIEEIYQGAERIEN